MNRYSERLPWSTPQNSYSVLLERKRLAGDPLLDIRATEHPLFVMKEGTIYVGGEAHAAH